MARISHEGTEVHWLPNCSDIDGPTVAEIASGVDLSPYVTKDGVNTPNAQNTVDTAGISSNFDSQSVGTWGGNVVLTMFRDDDDETDGYEAFEYRDAGFLVVSRFGAPVTGSAVEVYPVQAHQPVPTASAANEAQKFTVTFAVTDAPAMNAVVASS